jgi:hypothetical protein
VKLPPSFVNGWTLLCLGIPPFLEVPGREQRTILVAKLGKRGLGVFERKVRGRNRGLDAEGSACGDLLGDLDGLRASGVAVCCHLLNRSHPERFVRIPMIARQNEPHGISPAGFSWEANG